MFKVHRAFPYSNFALRCFTTATFYPQDIILLQHFYLVTLTTVTFCPRWCLLLRHIVPVMFTTTYDPLTYYSCNIFSRWCFTMTFPPRHILLQQHFNPVMFSCSDISSLWCLTSAKFHPRDVLLLQHFVLVTFCSCNSFIPIRYILVTNTHSAS